jgi:hypothetical protein
LEDDEYNAINSRNHEGKEDAGDLEDDEYDTNDYLLSIRDVMESYPGVELSMTADQRNRVSFAGDDSLPPLTSGPMLGLRKLSSLLSDDRFHSDTSLNSATATEVPTGFAKVGSASDGRVVIKWLNPSHRNKIVNLSAVMNRGAFCVPDYFPFSKAYMLFTKLGLRWIVVTGSNTGGEVVGILTRKNLLPGHIQACTKAKFE